MENMEPTKKTNKGLGIGIAIVAVAAVAVVAAMGGKKDDDQVAIPDTTTPTPVVTDTTPTPTPTTTPTKKSVYKDGTYSATGSYMSPGGMDQLAVTVTLKSDVITDVSVVPTAGDGTSKRYQAMFISGYKQYVVGKNIASVKLDKVSGSSLTPQGFNEALTQIKAQAIA